MFERRSLKLPITLGVLMIVSVIALTVGWVLLSAFGAVANDRWSSFYWTLLTVGTAFLVFVLVGVVLYLQLSVETINLNRRQSNAFSTCARSWPRFTMAPVIETTA